MIKYIETPMNILRSIVHFLVVLLFLYMLCAILTQVLGRYLSTYFDFSIAWTEETARFAQIWMILLGTGIAMQNKMHVGVDIILQYLPKKVSYGVMIVTAVASLIFLILTIVGSFKLIAIGRIQTSSAAGIPMWIVYYAMPIGLSYFAIELCLSTIKSICPCAETENELAELTDNESEVAK